MFGCLAQHSLRLPVNSELKNLRHLIRLLLNRPWLAQGSGGLSGVVTGVSQGKGAKSGQSMSVPRVLVKPGFLPVFSGYFH